MKMFFKQNEDFKKQIVLIDTDIHNKAKLSKEEFLQRIENINYLRTSYCDDYISFYITSINEYNNLIKFHELIHKGIFDFNYHKIFAIAIQPKLYNWFNSNKINIIQKQIVCWLAGSYFFNIDKRGIIKEQVYKPLYEEILKILEYYYKDFNLPDLSAKNESTQIDRERCVEKYLQVCKDYCNSEQPEFLNSPYGYKTIREWGVNDNHNFEFVQSYLYDEDWERIIINGYKDDMHRVESIDNLWLKWKHMYTSHKQQKKFVYSFFIENEKRKTKKRETIPQSVKNQVWKRDNGICVKCGTNEKLEFDHIIPVVMGGSSTYRNLQLLCESCNRKKYKNL